MDSFTVAMQNQLSFNKMLETQIQQISSALPRLGSGAPKEPIQESVKSITTILEGKATDYPEESLRKKIDGEDSGLDGSIALLPMFEVSTKAILSQLWNPLREPEVPNIQCIIGPLKVHYALCDWRASVNVMPKMVYSCLHEDPMIPISRCL